MKEVEARAMISNKAGLHARSAAIFVHEASRFEAHIEIKKEGNSGWMNAKTILGILTLGLTKGSYMLIKAKGTDADEAVSSLVNLINQRFNEGE